MNTHTAIAYSENLPASDPESIVEREIETPALGAHDLLVEIMSGIS